MLIKESHSFMIFMDTDRTTESSYNVFHIRRFFMNINWLLTLHPFKTDGRRDGPSTYMCMIYERG